MGLHAAMHGSLMNIGQKGERILPHNVAIVPGWQHGPFQQHSHTGRNMCQRFLESKAPSSLAFYSAAINPFPVVTVFIPLSETWWAETSHKTSKHSQSLNKAFYVQAPFFNLTSPSFGLDFFFRRIFACGSLYLLQGINEDEKNSVAPF